MTIISPSSPSHSSHLISTNGVRAQKIWHHPEPLFESTVNELIDIYEMHSNECCGFIDDEQNVYRIDNVHKYPRMNFFMEEEDVEETIYEIYEIKQSSVLGIFHTHPNGYPWPSPRDIVGWPNPKLGWRYFLVTFEGVSEWELV